MSSITIVPSVYVGGGKPGDFGWMITQPQYADGFFVFNDNEQQFLAHQRDLQCAEGCAAGGGNAVIRPWQCTAPPRAGGIPTGSDGAGYTTLTPAVAALIDQAIALIRSAVTANGFETIYFSSAGHGGLGTGIFRVGDDVKTYIVEQINTLAD